MRRCPMVLIMAATGQKSGTVTKIRHNPYGNAAHSPQEEKKATIMLSGLSWIVEMLGQRLKHDVNIELKWISYKDKKTRNPP